MIKKNSAVLSGNISLIILANMKFVNVITIFFITTIFPHTSAYTTVQITAVGDIYISNRMTVDRYNVLNNIKLEGDLVFGNAEGVFVSNCLDSDRLKFKLTMPYSAISILKRIGFNSLSYANNHVLNAGLIEYKKSCSLLHNDNFLLAGYDDSGDVINIHKKSIRIVGFTFTGRNNVNNIDTVTKLIKTFKEDIIIISAHMGGEGAGNCSIIDKPEFFGNQRRGEVRRFSRSCIDAGADLIIGHGPHFLRGIELYKGKLICYSLGNYIFDYPIIEKNGPSATCSITIDLEDDGNFKQAAIASYRIDNGIPINDNSMTAYQMIKLCSNESGLVFNDNGIITIEK
jgi:hypothetical protein